MQRGELLDYVFAIIAVAQEGFDIRLLHGQLATILMRQIYSCPHALSQKRRLGKTDKPTNIFIIPLLVWTQKEGPHKGGGRRNHSILRRGTRVFNNSMDYAMNHFKLC